jgi:hypothetical protein
LAFQEKRKEKEENISQGPQHKKATGEKPLQPPKFSASSSHSFLYLIYGTKMRETLQLSPAPSLSIITQINQMSLTIPKFTLPFCSPARKCLTCMAQLTNVPPSISTNTSGSVGRREGIFLLTAVATTVAQQLPSLSKSWALVLEAEDDLELLEKVKNDRKERLKRQGVINSSAAERGPCRASIFSSFICLIYVFLFVQNNVLMFGVNLSGYLQELVYRLSKVGQAIEQSDLSAASSVLGQNANADWVQNVNKAFTKV